MTGGAGAYFDHMLSLGFQGEILIKCGHAVHLGSADVQIFRHPGQGLFAEVLVRCLDLLHDGNQVCRIAVELRADLIDVRKIFHGPSSYVL